MWLASEVWHKRVATTSSEAKAASPHTSLKGYASSFQINRPPKAAGSQRMTFKAFCCWAQFAPLSCLKKNCMSFPSKNMKIKKKYQIEIYTLVLTWKLLNLSQLPWLLPHYVGLRWHTTSLSCLSFSDVKRETQKLKYSTSIKIALRHRTVIQHQWIHTSVN